MLNENNEINFFSKKKRGKHKMLFSLFNNYQIIVKDFYVIYVDAIIYIFDL